MGVVADSGGVGGTIALSSGLDPNNSINQGVAGGGSGAGAEACADDVAPITPLRADVLDTGTALVDDEVGREAVLGEEGAEGIDVVGLVVV